MPKGTRRYGRPSLEFEYSQEALTSIGCCRWVPGVLRVCGIPQDTILTVRFERVRKMFVQNVIACDDYEVHPYSDHFRVPNAAEGLEQRYREYAAEWLARPHATETGTIHLKLESSAFHVLCEFGIRLDSRKAEPVVTMEKGYLQAYRCLPQVRSRKEREALQGQFFPAAISQSPRTPVQPIPLFSLAPQD